MYAMDVLFAASFAYGIGEGLNYAFLEIITQYLDHYTAIFGDADMTTCLEDKTLGG